MSLELENMVFVKQSVFWLPFTKQEASKKYMLSTNGFSDTINYFLGSHTQ